MSDDNTKARIQETGYGFSIHQVLRDGYGVDQLQTGWPERR